MNYGTFEFLENGDLLLRWVDPADGENMMHMEIFDTVSRAVNFCKENGIFAMRDVF